MPCVEGARGDQRDPFCCLCASPSYCRGWRLGAAFLIHPQARYILGQPAYRAVAAVPTPVDLVIFQHRLDDVAMVLAALYDYAKMHATA